MANILTVGIATLDIINVVDAYPHEDSEVRAASQTKSRGGNATNTAVVLSQLGHHCTWAGVLIDEPDGQIIKQDLQRYNIDYSACLLLDKGKMPTSYISLNKHSGSRSIIHYRDCPEFSFTDFIMIDLNKFDWIHFEGRNIADTVQMLKHVKQHFPKMTCSVEIEKPRNNIEELFPLADLLLFSHHYARHHHFANAHDLLSSLTPSTLASCTWGQKGAWLLSPDQKIIHNPIFSPKPIVDTLGAGDTFNAALIHQLLDKKTLEQSLTYASQLAGHKCGQYGFSNLLDRFRFEKD